MKVLGANGLQYLITKLMGVDFIVEEGTSGIWTYRKWNSGIAECWGNWEGRITEYAQPMSGLHAYSTSVYFPFTFTEKPMVSYTAGAGDAFAWAGAITASSITTTYVNCYCVSTINGTQTLRIHIDARGRWK